MNGNLFPTHLRKLRNLSPHCSRTGRADKMGTHVVNNVFLAQIKDLLVIKLADDASVGNGCGRTAAVSTPVGPPPQTTKLSKRFRSSSDVDGSEAISKLSAKQTDERGEFGVEKYPPKMRRRMA